MYDQRLFMKTLSRFSVVLPKHYDLDAAALAERLFRLNRATRVEGADVGRP
jgi:hypothetical protein